jgi:hypothetical protein
MRQCVHQKGHELGEEGIMTGEIVQGVVSRNPRKFRRSNSNFSLQVS